MTPSFPGVLIGGCRPGPTPAVAAFRRRVPSLVGPAIAGYVTQAGVATTSSASSRLSSPGYPDYVLARCPPLRHRASRAWQHQSCNAVLAGTVSCSQLAGAYLRLSPVCSCRWPSRCRAALPASRGTFVSRLQVLSAIPDAYVPGLAGRTRCHDSPGPAASARVVRGFVRPGGSHWVDHGSLGRCRTGTRTRSRASVVLPAVGGSLIAIGAPVGAPSSLQFRSGSLDRLGCWSVSPAQHALSVLARGESLAATVASWLQAADSAGWPSSRLVSVAQRVGCHRHGGRGGLHPYWVIAGSRPRSLP